jgi:hypothetical protein
MTAGDATYIRIDVIECQPIANPAPETDTRDIFNPATGLFTPTTVQKTVGYVMSYRVRLGTPGAGFPGTASGWLPLTVASVPALSTANDTITFWDVRSLVQDRVLGPQNQTLTQPRRTKLLHSVSNLGSTNHAVNGIVEVTSADGLWRLGGPLRRGSPGVDAGQQYVDFSDPANQDNTFSLSTGSPTLAYYYLLTMFGLPRWSRYTDYVTLLTSRYPRGPRGIPLISNVPPNPITGIASAMIPMPAAFGFSGEEVTDAVCWGATTIVGGPALAQQSTADGWTIFNTSPAGHGGASPAGTINLTENVDFPAGATKIKVLFSCLLTIGTTSTVGNIDAYLAAKIAQHGAVASQFATVLAEAKNINVDNPAASTGVVLTWYVDVTMPTAIGQSPAGAIEYDFVYTVTATAMGVVMSAASAQVVAFKYE